MLLFVLTNIFMISLGVMLYLAVRALPRVGEDAHEAKLGVLDRWGASEIPERIDEILNNFLAKFLRKLKIWLLKADNATTAWLKKVKQDTNGPKPGFDIKDIVSEKMENGNREEKKTTP